MDVEECGAYLRPSDQLDMYFCQATTTVTIGMVINTGLQGGLESA